MDFEELTLKDVYGEIYDIARNSYKDEVRLEALSLLLKYKEGEETRAERQEAMTKIMSSMMSL